MKTTTYGTIPTASGDPSPEEFTSQPKARGRSPLSIFRPWREFIYARYFSLPSSISEAFLRIRSNATYFAKNYIILLLLIVFLSLLWHPVSLIVFILAMAFWLCFYFLRDEPVAVLGRIVDDRVLLLGLSFLTILVLVVTDGAANVLISLLVGGVVVLLHAGFRGWHAADEEVIAGDVVR